MKMYRCNECECEFADENASRYAWNPYTDEWENIDLDGTDTCPECGSMDLTVLEECEICGEYSESRLCHDCREKLRDVLEYAENTWALSSDDIAYMIDIVKEEEEKCTH